MDNVTQKVADQLIEHYCDADSSAQEVYDVLVTNHIDPVLAAEITEDVRPGDTYVKWG